MQLAILSDVHGNAVALDAVLADLAHDAPDGFLCLGDVANTGPQPVECVQRIADLGCPVVMGNADASILEPVVGDDDPTDDARRVEEIEAWCRSRLRREDLEAIRGYATSLELALGGLLLLACHGSPRSYHEGLTATTPTAVVDEALQGVSADVVALGHTHAPMARRHRETLLVNPGSVGMPFVETADGAVRNPAWAEYALLRTERGRLEVALRRTPYDLDALHAAVRNAGMPHAAWWSGDWRA